MPSRSLLRSCSLLALALLALACSPERKAKQELDKYEVAFDECRKISEELGADPGTHYCSKVASMALEMALDEAGLDEAARDRMIADWAAASPLGKYYADERAREAIPDL